MFDVHCWPPNPGESVIKSLPIVALFLTLPVQPVVQKPRDLDSERIAHLPVIRDAVVVQMPHLFQFRAVLLLRSLPLHLEAPVARLPAIMREAQKIEGLWLPATTPCTFRC